MKKILVLGASGMAGHVVYTYLTELNKYNVVGTTNNNNLEGISLKMNIFDRKEVENVIEDVKPDIIINCIGMLIRSSRSNPDQTIYGNAYFPYILKNLAHKNNAKLIHISTDCVFSGKVGSYEEDSFKDATDIYGLSKNLGEINDSENLTIRTSIIGPELKQNGEGLFHWFMHQKGAVNGFKSNIWSGVTTLELAKFIDWVIDNPIVGLIHLTNNDSISKYNLLHIFNDVYQKDLIIVDEKDYVCNKSFISTNDKMTYMVPKYQEMIEDQKEFMLHHKKFYENYF
ncbi:SDR family oxidoreductase [Elizabethkingia anophelis]|uniref:dTDP-4-dehydrorhamnose reductase family protein n=1 Tax=Elizabethkingia anophelis TaxID=1117645 RepID=UPI000400E0D2|nr:SDR family oxidoreductase [Elizabethkingia anophelis]MCT3746624.1 SDR family oxidoreductase [Elizabethkingia anophelis]MCT3924706.1 SDR family oxidoreductase [Elizabethkingia anophelis]MCT4063858.1 SDR family oxidoreductase [Elizabethkingia anophelis]MCT4110098.1 SDR family oxidoreductase [Elizabethkingia anophelis]MDC8026371.1 SDR family oxidoreductase [Elizabethkingia anophelis]